MRISRFLPQQLLELSPSGFRFALGFFDPLAVQAPRKAPWEAFLELGDEGNLPGLVPDERCFTYRLYVTHGQTHLMTAKKVNERPAGDHVVLG